MTMSFRLIIVLVASIATGCATLTKGTTQLVAINTPGVIDAECHVTSEHMARKITPPITISVAKSAAVITVTCQAKCFQPGSTKLLPKPDMMTAGNALAGGLVGVAVDMATGADYYYDQEASVLMEPDPECTAPIKQRRLH